jgi:glycosyltransferase involved in cell wall biosynthesis
MTASPSRKKIALVIPSLSRGGAERVMSLLHSYFSLHHEVHLIIFHDPVEYDIHGEVTNLNLPNTGGILTSVINIFRRTFRLRKAFKKIQPDLIISFIGNLQPILTGFPVVVSIRIDLDYADEFSKPWAHKIQLKTLYKLPNVKKIVPCSFGIEKKMKARYGFANLETIHNPLDFEMIDKLLEKDRPLDFDYVLAVGGFKSQNAFDLLIKAYAASNTRKSLKLVIVGDGQLRPEFEALIQELGLANEVILAGKQKNPFIYMKYCTLYILPSLYEGFPNVLAEALACGAACISTDCETGPNEMIVSGENGILIPVGDIAAITESMDRLFANKSLLETFRSRARDSVSHLALPRIGERWLSFLDQ